MVKYSYYYKGKYRRLLGDLTKYMSKFYAVKGEENLIFTSWEDCRFFLDGKKGYKYKSFSTEEEAKAYLEDRDYYGELISADLSEGYAVAFTDGSFEENVGRYSYGVIAVNLDGEEQKLCGSGSVSEFLPSRNVAGEVEGVLSALNWAFLNGYKKIKIYHDYEGLATWYDGRWGFSSPIATYYVSKISKYKGVLDVCFQKVKGHSNNKYNDLVDKLAKEALFEGKTLTVDGIGYKISGNYFIDDFIKWLNKKAPKAKVLQTDEKTTFTLDGKHLSLYFGLTSSAVVGDNRFLHALSTLYFIENHKEIGVNRLIERFFNVCIEKEEQFDGYQIAEISLDFYGDNKAPAIIFALWEIENLIKKKTGANDKISPLFEKTDDGFSFKGQIENKRAIERAYEFFFNLRINYFNLNLSEEETKKIIADAKQIHKEAE